MRIYLKSTQRTEKLNLKRIRRDISTALRLLGFQQAELSVLFAGTRRVRTLNALYRGIDKVTDVLSFPMFEATGCSAPQLSESGMLGDIVVCIPKTIAQASEYGVSFYDELLRLMIHGLLHLVGYDHEINAYQKKKMEAKERDILDAIKKMG